MYRTTLRVRVFDEMGDMLIRCKRGRCAYCTSASSI